MHQTHASDDARESWRGVVACRCLATLSLGAVCGVVFTEPVVGSFLQKQTDPGILRVPVQAEAGVSLVAG